jgi:YesN/AraC family two-component response regulator
MNVKAILVDDEAIIREGILRMINWDGLGVEVIADCPNAYLALDVMRDAAPDILMTDVKMPGLDGLALIERALAINPRLECIVLSGYDEFDFARNAMRMGVREYLLKPCSQAEMESALTRALQRIQSRPNEISTLDSLPALDNAAVPHVRRAFVEQMAEYVQRHYQRPELSLQYLADNVAHMNADYIGKEFTREMGMKFSTYLMRERMERAKRLLAAPQELRIYEIAEQVGLGHNPQYFSRLFYSYEGLTPKAYREAALSARGS